MFFPCSLYITCLSTQQAETPGRTKSWLLSSICLAFENPAQTPYGREEEGTIDSLSLAFSELGSEPWDRAWEASTPWAW